jgi:hypothetical protein
MKLVGAIFELYTSWRDQCHHGQTFLDVLHNFLVFVLKKVTLFPLYIQSYYHTSSSKACGAGDGCAAAARRPREVVDGPPRAAEGGIDADADADARGGSGCSPP